MYSGNFVLEWNKLFWQGCLLGSKEMERKEPCQGSSTFPASISALGLPGCSAPASQVIGTGSCSREGGHRQTLQKPNYTFGGSQISQHQSPWTICPFQRGHPKGTCPWVVSPQSTDHGWPQDMLLEQGRHIHVEIPPLHAERPLHVSSLLWSW